MLAGNVKLDIKWLTALAQIGAILYMNGFELTERSPSAKLALIKLAYIYYYFL